MHFLLRRESLDTDIAQDNHVRRWRVMVVYWAEGKPDKGPSFQSWEKADPADTFVRDFKALERRQ